MRVPAPLAAAATASSSRRSSSPASNPISLVTPRLFELLREGGLTPVVAGRFALADAAEAMRFAERGGHTGKVVLESKA